VSEVFLRSLRLEIPVNSDTTVDSAGSRPEVQAKVPKLAISKDTVKRLASCVRLALQTLGEQLREQTGSSEGEGSLVLHAALSNQRLKLEESHRNHLIEALEAQRKEMQREANLVGGVGWSGAGGSSSSPGRGVAFLVGGEEEDLVVRGSVAGSACSSTSSEAVWEDNTATGSPYPVHDCSTHVGELHLHHKGPPPRGMRSSSPGLDSLLNRGLERGYNTAAAAGGGGLRQQQQGQGARQKVIPFLTCFGFGFKFRVRVRISVNSNSALGNRHKSLLPHRDGMCSVPHRILLGSIQQCVAKSRKIVPNLLKPFGRKICNLMEYSDPEGITQKPFFGPFLASWSHFQERIENSRISVF